MNTEQQKLLEFHKGREQLINVGARKQQLQVQAAMIQSALDELKDSKQGKVYKIVGNIMIEKDAKQVEKELKELKEQLDARIETLQKQEDSLINRLNKLRSQLEGQEKKKD